MAVLDVVCRMFGKNLETRKETRKAEVLKIDAIDRNAVLVADALGGARVQV